MKNYSLLDSGHQKKLEQFGEYTLVRPCSQALWQPRFSKEKWETIHASFSREGGNRWDQSYHLPESWVVELEGIKFKIAPTDFGHLGVFPEHALLWTWAARCIEQSRRSSCSVLNLFAYSGGATLACAKAGAEVCHVDASKGMVAWARENAGLNQLSNAPIRWIIDDVMKFLKREIKRGRRYDGIILDPPSFGRGSQGEVFKLENDMLEILDLCRQLLSEKPLFVALSNHTSGITAKVLEHLLRDMMKSNTGTYECGELLIPAASGLSLPSGCFARWSHERT